MVAKMLNQRDARGVDRLAVPTQSSCGRTESAKILSQTDSP